MREESTIDLTNVGDETIRVGAEDLVATSELVITHEDIAEGDMRALFEPPLMRLFVEFLSAGLPESFLRSNPELKRTENQELIREAIIRVPDRALKGYLTSRLEAIERHSADAEDQP